MGGSDRVSCRPIKSLFERTFDVAHFHIEYLGFPFARMLPEPTVTTLHGPLPDVPELFAAFGGLPFVSISNAQRTPYLDVNWRRTIYHGLPRDLYTFVPDRGKYLVFLGRIASEKGCDRAIEIAKRSGVPLKIAAKIDPYDQLYFDTNIRELLDCSLVDFIGEIAEAEKNRLLGGAPRRVTSSPAQNCPRRGCGMHEQLRKRGPLAHQHKQALPLCRTYSSKHGRTNSVPGIIFPSNYLGRLRNENNPQAAVRFVLKHFVSFWRAFERYPMRRQKRCI